MAKKKKTTGQHMLANAPDSNTLPDGGYILTVSDLEPTSTSAGKKMFKATLKVKDAGKGNEHLKGFTLFEYFVIGSDEDPEANEAKTWQRFGAQRLKQLVVKCGAGLDYDDDEDLCDAVKGQDVFTVVVIVEEKEGDYKGDLRNKLKQFYEPGERDPGVKDDKGGKVTKKAAPKRDEEEDEEEEEEAPKPKKGKAKVKPEPEEEDEDEDDDEDEDEDDDEDEEVPAKKGKGRRRS